VTHGNRDPVTLRRAADQPTPVWSGRGLAGGEACGRRAWSADPSQVGRPAGAGPVRRYLRRLGVPELNIAQYVAEARRGGPVTVSFGSNNKGVMPPLRLYCPGGSEFELTSPMS